MPIGLLRLAVPILACLVIIRALARVLRRGLPQFAGGARLRAHVVVAGLDRPGAVGHRPAAAGARARWRSCSWKIGGTDVTLLRHRRGRADGAGCVLVVALWLSAAIEARLLRAVAHQPVGAQDRRQRDARAAAAGRPAGGAVGGRHSARPRCRCSAARSASASASACRSSPPTTCSGFVILAERSLRIGDMVKVDNFEGRITDITTRYTVIRALQRPRVDRAQRDADHAAGRELVARRSERVR